MDQPPSPPPPPQRPPQSPAAAPSQPTESPTTTNTPTTTPPPPLHTLAVTVPDPSKRDPHIATVTSTPQLNLVPEPAPKAHNSSPGPAHKAPTLSKARGFNSISENLGFKRSAATEKVFYEYEDTGCKTIIHGCGVVQDDFKNSIKIHRVKNNNNNNSDNDNDGCDYNVEERSHKDENNNSPKSSGDEPTLKTDRDDLLNTLRVNKQPITANSVFDDTNTLKPYTNNNTNKRFSSSSSLESNSLTYLDFQPSSGKSSSTPDHSSFSSAPTAPSATSVLNLNLNLPDLADTVTHGFGVKMVASSSCQQLIYRSVPPRPLSYTLTDVLEVKGPSFRSKTAPVSSNSPEDYAQRFKSRPTTRPRVIDFDGSTVSSKTKKLALGSTGFPTSRAKIYIGHLKATSPTQSQTSRGIGAKIHLAPLGGETPGRRSSAGFPPGSSKTARTVDRSYVHTGAQRTSTTRTGSKSAGSSLPDGTAKSSIAGKPPTRETIQSAEFSMSVPRALTPDPEDHIHNPELLLTSSTDCDDLSILPRPKKVLPKRELPWVFRYKVKKGMNTLSRIMASKPSSTGASQPNYSLT